MDVNPYRVFAYWGADPSHLAGIRERIAQGGHEPSRLVLRVYDVTLIEFDGSNANHSFDLPVEQVPGARYIDLWAPGPSLCAELGWVASSGRFCALARSNYVHLPRGRESDVYEERWVRADRERSGPGDLLEVLITRPRSAGS